MPRETWVWRQKADGTWGHVLKYGPEDTGHPFSARADVRSNLAAPHFITDHIGELIGQHDGKVYTSKSELRKSYRQNGLVELGNDAPREAAEKPNWNKVTQSEIAQAYQQVSQGYKPQLAPAELDLSQE
jgi:hypothetical protein